MSKISLNRTSDLNLTPRANIDVLKLRFIKQKRKDKIKRTIIFTSIFLSLGILSIISY